MTGKITLSRPKLATYLSCQRRFQLRYLRQLPWPPLPVDERSEARVAQGQQFHQLLERYFLGLSVPTEPHEDSNVRRWWSLFQSSQPAIPTGQLHPEISLTVPVGRHLLNGRFDLLVVGKEGDLPFAHIFDWKTGRAQREAELREDWQTRLYFALVAKGGAALLGPIDPDQIAITYWYVTEPDRPHTIRYNRAWHQRNWTEIEELVERIDGSLTGMDWPLTDDWSQCRRCPYQTYCGRQDAGTTTPDEADEDDFREAAVLFLEPELP